MKIKIGRGTPVFVYERDNGAAVIMQGTSFIRLSAPEIDAVISALRPGKTALTDLDMLY